MARDTVLAITSYLRQYSGMIFFFTDISRLHAACELAIGQVEMDSFFGIEALWIF